MNFMATFVVACKKIELIVVFKTDNQIFGYTIEDFGSITRFVQI